MSLAKIRYFNYYKATCGKECNRHGTAIEIVLNAYDTFVPHIRGETMKIDALKHARALKWVNEVVDLCTPDSVYVCDGSTEEYDRLMQKLVDVKLATPLKKAEEQFSIPFGSVGRRPCRKQNIHCFKKRRRCRSDQSLDRSGRVEKNNERFI